MKSHLVIRNDLCSLFANHEMPSYTQEDIKNGDIFEVEQKL